MSERKTIGGAVYLTAIVDPVETAVMTFNPNAQFYDADNGGNAISTAQYPIGFMVTVGNTVVSPNGAPNVTFEGDDTTGITAVAAGTTGFTVQVAQNSHPNCRIKVVTSVTKNGQNHEVIGYLSISPIKMGAQGGSVSALSKMYYYAGVYASNKTYSLTATQAPYVMYGTDFYVLDNAANGGAGTTARNVTPVNNGDPWTKMDSEMKYYIAEAMFANFAKLGSAIFNLDFMLSQYGALMGYGGFNIPVTNTNYYQRADAQNMLGEITSYVHEGKTATTVSSSEYNSENYRFGVSLDASKRYMIVIQCEAAAESGVTVKLTTAVDYWDEVFERTITDNTPVVLDISVWSTGTYKLFFKRTGSSSTNPKITYTMVSLDTFRPNVFIDYKKGFLYSNKGQFDEGVFNKGFFGDVTIEGRINNLITVIDWNGGVGRDKIIKAYYHQNSFVDYTGSGVYDEVRYYIDVLACGDFIVIKSFPEYGTGIRYRLPYYALDILQDRGHTVRQDGTKGMMTGDEMRQLLGRRLTIKLEMGANASYPTKLTGGLILTPMTTTNNQYLANGQNYFLIPDPNHQYGNQDHYSEHSIPFISQVVHLECKPVVWTTVASYVDYAGYGYVWIGDGYEPSSQTTTGKVDGLDSWT